MTHNTSFYRMNAINSTTTFSLTSASTASTNYLFDDNDATKLQSIASSDTVSEIWDFTFTGPVSVSALHLANHNFKQFSIKKWSTTAFVDFSTPIATTTNSGTYHFMDTFTPCVTSKIRIQADTTIVADAQKSAGQFRVLSMIGEMSKNPKKAVVKYHENSKNYYTDSKENVFVLFGTSMKMDLDWVNLQATDMTILESCKYLGEPFYAYLAPGGNTYARRGWRIQDIILVNYTNSFDPKISDNLMANGEDIKITLESVKVRNMA